MTPADRDVRGSASAARRGPPTIAVVTDGPILERWQAAAVRALRDAGSPVSFWIHHGTRPSTPTAAATALEATPAAEVPTGLPMPMAVREGDRLPVDVDVLLDLTRLGTGRPRHGAGETWAYSYGSEASSEPVAVAMRAIVRGSGPIRVQLTAWPDGRVLRRGAVRTVSGSLAAQLDRLLLEPAAWPAQAAVDSSPPGSPIAVEGGAGDTAGTSDSAPAHSSQSTEPDRTATAIRGVDSSIPAAPTLLLRVGVAARMVQSRAEALLRHSDWTIGVVRRPIATWLDVNAAPTVSWLPSRAGRYAADPFGLERGGRTHVLFEDYDQRRGRGVISSTSVGSSGDWEKPEVVLDTGSHASYPYLLEADGETWLIPETSDLGEVRLYRAIEFPRRWSLEARLLWETEVSDATVIHHDRSWWMFGTSRGRGVDEALRIWHAPALTGPWRIHALDPVKIDAASARPGGTPFVEGGILYRPAQDCSNRYGERLTINRVDLLDDRRFAEAPVRSIGPLLPYPDGLHTLSAAGPFTLIDGNRLRFVPEALAHALAGRLPG